jgi:hypothetical protein
MYRDHERQLSLNVGGNALGIHDQSVGDVVLERQQVIIS